MSAAKKQRRASAKAKRGRKLARFQAALIEIAATGEQAVAAFCALVARMEHR